MSKQQSSDLLEDTYKNLYESPYGEHIFSSLDDDVDNQVQPVQCMTSQKSDNSCAPPMVKKMTVSLLSGRLEKTTMSSPHHVAQHPVQQDLKQHHLMLPEAAGMAQNCPLWRMMSTYGAAQC